MILQFMKGIELNRKFYHEVCKPILDKYYPNLQYSCGLIGYGSDVLGYDTYISMDHMWGPRLYIFLNSDDYEQYHSDIHKTFGQRLPYMFLGYSTNFSKPDAGGVSRMQIAKGLPINHLIVVTEVKSFFEYHVGNLLETQHNIDWLNASSQKLMEVTRGAIYHDGLGIVNPIRAKLQRYPDDVLRLKMAALWKSIAEEIAFIGRAIEFDDEIHVNVLISRIISRIMKLCFLIEKKYIPYSKWINIAFTELRCYNAMSKEFKIIYDAPFSKKDKAVAIALKELMRHQNAMLYCKTFKAKVKNYYGRPYKVIDIDTIIQLLLDSIHDKELLNVDLNALAIMEDKNGLSDIDNFEIKV